MAGETFGTHSQGVGATVDITNLMRKLRDVKAELDGRTILQTVGQRHLYWTGMNAQQAGRYSDKAAGPATVWQRMADRTLERRRKRGDTAPSDSHFVERYQQLLQQSMTSRVDGESQVSVGTAARFAIYHHLGAKRGGWRLPARPLVPTPDAGAKMAEAVLEAIAARITAKAGGR